MVSVRPGFRQQRFGLLLENGHAHRDVEPIDPMLTIGLHILLHPLHILAAAASRIGLHVAEALRLRDLIVGLPPKRDYCRSRKFNPRTRKAVDNTWIGG